jgi:hypothetical protein
MSAPNIPVPDEFYPNHLAFDPNEAYLQSYGGASEKYVALDLLIWSSYGAALFVLGKMIIEGGELVSNRVIGKSGGEYNDILKGGMVIGVLLGVHYIAKKNHETFTSAAV